MQNNTEKTVDIKAWVNDVIKKPGGWLSWNERELYDCHEKSRDHSVVEFFLRCLANPDCEGSEEVLNAIIERRKSKANARG